MLTASGAGRKAWSLFRRHWSFWVAGLLAASLTGVDWLMPEPSLWINAPAVAGLIWMCAYPVYRALMDALDAIAGW